MVGEREVQAEDRVIATSQTFKVEAKLAMMVVIMMVVVKLVAKLVMMVVIMMLLVVSLVAMATSQTFTVAISNA